MNYPKSLNNLLQKLSKLEEFLYLVVLFGSYARNEAKRHSDIDLLIVLKEYNEPLHHQIISLVDEAMAEADYDELLSPHIIDLNHYMKMKEYKTDLFQSITEEGDILWKAA